MSISTMLEHGATKKRMPDSTCYVSEWHIPGGADYEGAYLVHAFFSSRQKAEDYANVYNTPPEMPSVIDLVSPAITVKKHDAARFSALRIRPNGCGMFFLKFFDKVLEKQPINPYIIDRFKKCSNLDDLFFLISVFTIQE